MNNIVGSRCVPATLLQRLGSVAAFALLLSILFSRSANAQLRFPVQSDDSLVQSADSPAQDADSLVQSDDSLVQSNNDEQEKQTLKQLLRPLSAGVVQIRNRDRLCCLGTIVAKGLVVTKRSELSGSLTCITSDGTHVSAVIVASDQGDDLALLRLALPTSTSESSDRIVAFGGGADVAPGDVLFSVGPDANPLSAGVATVAPQRIPVAQPACRDCVDLGVTVSVRSAAVRVARIWQGDKWLMNREIVGVKVRRVYPRTVGERVGILRGDLLVSINQQWVSNAATLRSIGARVRVGQRVDVVVVRMGALKQLSIKVDHFLRQVYHDRWGGGPFSERRFGFSTTIVHDSLLEPNQCGGPLVDLDGNVVGLNIARSMRVATLAVPADRVRDFVDRFEYATPQPR